jgi:hypothetical protein
MPPIFFDSTYDQTDDVQKRRSIREKRIREAAEATQHVGSQHQAELDAIERSPWSDARKRTVRG